MTRIFLRIWLVLLGLTLGGMAIGLLILVTTGNAHANAVLSQPFQPTSINRMVSSSSLVTASTRFAGVTAANQSVYAVKAVNIGKATVANAIRTRSFTPWALGLTAALTVAGYILTEDGQITTGSNPEYQQGYYWRSTQYGIATTQTDALNQYADLYGNNATPLYWQYENAQESQIRTFISYFNGNFDVTISTTFNKLACNGTTSACPATAPAGDPVSDEALFDVYSNLSPSQQTDLLTDPLTGFPDAANIPEFQQAADEISSNWNANYDEDPNTVPEPDPTEQTSEEPFPEEQPEQDICKANPEILACQELGETPDETPIDEQELPFDYQPVSFSGNASCPASIQMGGGIQYDYDAACSFASGVKPAVITMALLTGVFVMGGFRR